MKEERGKNRKNPEEIAIQQFPNLANAIKTHRSQKLNEAQAQEKKKYANTSDLNFSNSIIRNKSESRHRKKAH